jgi:hypothetical protein
MCACSHVDYLVGTGAIKHTRFLSTRWQACHHARLRKGRWAAPAPLCGPCRVLDPACAWWLAVRAQGYNTRLELPLSFMGRFLWFASFVLF